MKQRGIFCNYCRCMWSFFFSSVTCQLTEDVVGIVLTAVVQGCRWMKQMTGEEGRRWGGGEERRVMGSGCRKSDCEAPNTLFAIYFFQEVHPPLPRLPLPPPFLSSSTPLLTLLTFSFNTPYLLLINDFYAAFSRPSRRILLVPVESDHSGCSVKGVHNCYTGRLHILDHMYVLLCVCVRM